MIIAYINTFKESIISNGRYAHSAKLWEQDHIEHRYFEAKITLIWIVKYSTVFVQFYQMYEKRIF